MDSFPVPVSSLSWFPPIHCPTTIRPCFAHFLWLWGSINFSGCLISPYLPLLCLLHCPLFPAGCDNPQQFSWWAANGFFDIHSLFTPTRTGTFDALRSSHNIPLREHYSYLQLRHFLQQLIKSRPIPYTLTPFKSLCRAWPHFSGLRIYSSIISYKKPPLSPCLQWEAELEGQQDPKDW